jgi:hypothetical protein
MLMAYFLFLFYWIPTFDDVNSFPGQNPAGLGYVADGCTYTYVMTAAVMMDCPVAGFGVVDVPISDGRG